MAALLVKRNDVATPPIYSRSLYPLVCGGRHEGELAEVARGLRAACRPVPARWRGQYSDMQSVRSLIASTFESVIPPKDSIITWVPGHDNSGGPGSVLGAILSELWGIPGHQIIDRVDVASSAFESACHPPARELIPTLRTVGCSSATDVIVVDNVVASGASMGACCEVLTRAGWRVRMALAVTIDLKAFHRSPSSGSFDCESRWAGPWLLGN